MNFNDVSGIEIDLENADCDIVLGKKFEISDETECLSYTQCGIWFLRYNKSDNKKIVVTIPCDIELDKFILKLKNGTVNACRLRALDADFYISDANCVVSEVNSRILYMQLGRGRLSAKINHDVSAAFNCGSGDMRLRFNREQSQYGIKTMRGTGDIFLNGLKTKREFSSNQNEKPEINIKCGLGMVQVHFD